MYGSEHAAKNGSFFLSFSCLFSLINNRPGVIICRWGRFPYLIECNLLARHCSITYLHEIGYYLKNLYDSLGCGAFIIKKIIEFVFCRDIGHVNELIIY
jgi:hypothetical protein